MTKLSTKIKNAEAKLTKLITKLEALRAQCKHPTKAVVFEEWPTKDDYGNPAPSMGRFKCGVCARESRSVVSPHRGWDVLLDIQKPVYAEFTGRTLKNVIRPS